MKFIKKLLPLITLILSWNVFMANGSITNQLPSEQTMSQMQQAPAVSPSFATRGFDEGPPEEGAGGGGAMGIPVGSPHILSLLVLGVIYILSQKRKRENKY